MVVVKSVDESAGSVDAHGSYLENNNKESEREGGVTEGLLHENCRESVSPLSRARAHTHKPPPTIRRIVRRTRALGQEARDKTREGGGGVNKQKKLQNRYRRDVENGGDLVAR